MEKEEKFLSMTPFPKIPFNNKGAANSGRNPPSCRFSPLLTPSPDIAFITEEDTSCINEEVIGAINEAAIGPNIAGRNPPFFYFVFHCFTSTMKK